MSEDDWKWIICWIFWGFGAYTLLWIIILTIVIKHLMAAYG